MKISNFINLLTLSFIFPMVLLGSTTNGSDTMLVAYDQKLIDEGFPSPTLQIIFDSNQSGLFLVDTGASSNVLASWFSKKLSQDKKSEMSVPDSTGKMIKVSLAQSDFKIGERTFKKQSFLITDFPPDFEKNKIAGILSPKALGPVVAIDFKNRQLWVGESIEKAPKLLRLPLLNRKKQTSCVAHSASMYSIDTLISKHKAKLLVDSGAGTTKIFLNSHVGQILKTAAKSTGKKTSGLSGQKVDLLEVPQGRVEIGSYKTSASVLIQDANGKGCPSDGLLGMDLLKNCTILMLKEDFGILCK